MSAAIIDLVPRIAEHRPREIDSQLVSLCEQLLQLADEGTLTGFALIGLNFNGSYFVDSGGAVRTVPRRRITGSMLLSLTDHLTDLDRVAPQ